MKPCRVLAADDDPIVGLLLPAALPSPAFAVTYVADGASALAAAEEGEFDIVLLDVDMPGLDGLAVCTELRRRVGPTLPVVLLTGRTDPAFTARLASLSAEYLAKPVDWGKLAGFLRSVCAAQEGRGA